MCEYMNINMYVHMHTKDKKRKNEKSILFELRLLIQSNAFKFTREYIQTLAWMAIIYQMEIFSESLSSIPLVFCTQVWFDQKLIYRYF